MKRQENLPMKTFMVAAGFAVLAGAGITAQKAAAPAKSYAPAKTSWGDPNLQGVYTDKDENGIPFERPSQFDGKQELDDSELADVVRERQARAVASAGTIGGAAGADTGAGPVHWYEHYGAKNSRPWMVIDPPDGKIPPLTEAAQQRAAARAAARNSHGPADSYDDRSLYDQCITRGVVGSMLPVIYGNSFQIIQAPGYVAIRYEMIHETRVIPTDGRPHAPSKIRTYMGDPRGHWEGNTLVVETTNFTGRTAIGVNGNGTFNSESLRLIERFTPVSAGVVEWKVTVEDPATWTRPWTFELNLTRDETQGVFEYACHEGNYAMHNILSAARAEEKAAR
jgi:hypothetical protein